MNFKGLEKDKDPSELNTNVKRLIEQQEGKKNILLLPPASVDIKKPNSYELLKKHLYNKSCMDCIFKDPMTMYCNNFREIIYDSKWYAFSCDEMEEISR